MELLTHFFQGGLLAQSVGIASFAMGVFAFLQQQDNRLKVAIAVSAALMSVHFALIGASVGALAAAISATRFLCSEYLRLPFLGVLFIGLYLVIGFSQYEIWGDVFPIIAGVGGTIAVFYFRGIPMRLLLMVAMFGWLTHNIYYGSLGGVLLEIFFIATNLRTILALQKMNS